jgi:hypothetical protein
MQKYMQKRQHKNVYEAVMVQYVDVFVNFRELITRKQTTFKNTNDSRGKDRVIFCRIGLYANHVWKFKNPSE